MAKDYVLDTSAIFALTKDEPGADKVEKILKDGGRGKFVIFLSFATLLELYYITHQEKGEKAARELLLMVKTLPVERVESSERLILIAGRIKANYHLSVADSLIVATAIEKEAILVHKDPELEVVSSHVQTLQLPYKKMEKVR